MIKTINSAPVVNRFEIGDKYHEPCIDKDGNLYLPIILPIYAERDIQQFKIAYLKIPKELKVIEE